MLRTIREVWLLRGVKPCSEGWGLWVPMRESQPSCEEPKGLPVVVVGAGPVGLVAAAHLVSRGLEFLLIESGAQVGDSINSWRETRMFSPWRMNLDAVATNLLSATGWSRPPDGDFATGAELLERYLIPLSRLPRIRRRLLLSQRVIGISRRSMDKVKSTGRAERPFVVRVVDEAGKTSEILAAAVLDASGTWKSPNYAGSSGLPALGEEEARSAIRYGIPDVLGVERSRYAGKQVAVLGSGHSAIHSVLNLVTLKDSDPKTTITWLMRRKLSQAKGGGAQDALPERGAIGSRAAAAAQRGDVRLLTPFRMHQIARGASGKLVLQAEAGDAIPGTEVDELIVATGSRPDLTFLNELRLELDVGLECPRALASLIDPNEHSCGTVRPHGHRELSHREEPGIYLVGSKCYGRAPTFLMATGNEQVRSVVAALAGDMPAADSVELKLPKTGVCVTDGGEGDDEGCCGSQPSSSDGCCGAPVSGVATPPSAQSFSERADSGGCC